MSIEAPNSQQILDIADSFGMNLTLEDAQSFVSLMAGLKQSYDRVDAMVEPRLPVKYPRTPGRELAPEENPYNAWTFKTEIKGASRGKLAGQARCNQGTVYLRSPAFR